MITKMRYKESAPLIALRGKTALVKDMSFDVNTETLMISAQFDFDDGEPAVPGSVLHKFQFGWHRLRYDSFEPVA